MQRINPDQINDKRYLHQRENHPDPEQLRVFHDPEPCDGTVLYLGRQNGNQRENQIRGKTDRGACPQFPVILFFQLDGSRKRHKKKRHEKPPCVVFGVERGEDRVQDRNKRDDKTGQKEPPQAVTAPRTCCPSKIGNHPRKGKARQIRGQRTVADLFAREHGSAPDDIRNHKHGADDRQRRHRLGVSQHVITQKHIG